MAKSNKEAAEKVGINPNTVSNWSRPVRDAIETVGLRYRLDAATAARLVLEGAALQAALIKIQALDDIEERQKASTEILDRVLGKARQTVEHKGENLAPKTYVGWSPDEWGDQPSGEG